MIRSSAVIVGGGAIASTVYAAATFSTSGASAFTTNEGGLAPWARDSIFAALAIGLITWILNQLVKAIQELETAIGGFETAVAELVTEVQLTKQAALNTQGEKYADQLEALRRELAATRKGDSA